MTCISVDHIKDARSLLGTKGHQTTLYHTSQMMMCFHSKFHKAAGMDKSNRKILLLVLMLLLSQLACDAHSMSECCRQPYPSCRLYVLLCRSGSKTLGEALTSDAAAGILTLGKRKEDDTRLQSRLAHLLHVSRNPAAGILTMGKRTDGRSSEYTDWMAQSGVSITTPVLS
ncbi:orexin isoform X2 [Notolabrus celidotus]|uniref:orexin isoform X2 n=1 Tax=Notolabrus celidotus TaxID=1203425 RepID=UPI001490687B|nr:orexin isoform X2 [Notolabrus celidotus]